MSARHRKCPTPAKVTYPSREAALRVVRSLGPGRESRPYKCKDHWHLTSNAVRKPRRRR